MKTYIIILFTLLTSAVYGQGSTNENDKSFGSMGADGASDMPIEKRIDRFFKFIPKEKFNPVLSQKELDVTIFNNVLYIPKALEESYIINQINLADNNLGLELLINGRYNLSNIAAPEVETGDNLTRYSAYVGVEWSVLNKGWRANKLKAEQLTTEFEIQRLQRQENHDKEQLMHHQLQINTLFNDLLLSELKYHKALYQEQIRLYQELYFENLTPYSTIITLKKDRQQIETQITQLESVNKHFENNLRTDISELPIFDLDLDAIIGLYKSNTILEDSLVKKKKELLERSYKLKDLPSLSVYGLHRTFQSQNGNSLSHSPVVGFNFEMPLQYKKPFLDQGKMLEGQIIDEELRLKREMDIKMICEYYHEYQRILKNVKGLYYQLYWEKEQLQTALISKQRADEKIGITTVSHLNNVFQIRREILNNQKELYVFALHIFTMVGMESLSPTSDMLVKINWEEIRPNRAIIAIDADKGLKDIQFYVNYMKRKNYNKVYLKGAKNQKFKLAAELLNMEGFEVYFTINEDVIEKDVNTFANSKELKRFLSRENNEYLLSDIHELIELEKVNYYKSLSLN